MDTLDQPKETPIQATDTVQTPSRKKLNHQRKNFVFLSVALFGVFILFATVSAIISRRASNHSSEEKQREYNQKYDSLTPSTSQTRPESIQKTSDNQNVKAVESVQMDDLDSQFSNVDTELKSL